MNKFEIANLLAILFYYVTFSKICMAPILDVVRTNKETV